MTAPFPSPIADQAELPHAVVIGAGLGGLAAAARLGAKGYRVTVLEKLDGPGGRAYVFRQDGFTFDAGPTIVTAPYIFEQLWEACGAKLSDDVELRACDPFYKIRFDDGSVFNYSGDPEKMRAEVARFNPEDVEGLARFMKRSGEIYKVAFEELADKPFHSLLFTAKAMADLVRLGGYWPVYSTVSRFFKDPRLRIVFSFHPLLIGGNPFATTSYYCLIAHLESKYGVHYAVGGTGALVRGIAGLIERQGGLIRYDSEVAEIATDGRRVSGVRLPIGRVHRRRHRRFQRRSGLDLWQAAGQSSPPPLDRRQDRARGLFDEPVRLVFRHEPQLRRRLPPHHGAWVRATRGCSRTFSRSTSWRRISASTCTARRRTIRRWRRKAATPSTCSAPCRIWQAARTGPSRPSATAPRSSSGWRKR